MSDEIREKINSILTQVDELHAKEAQLQAEKIRQQEIAQAAEAEIDRCNAELKEVRANVLDRKAEMEKAHAELFGITEDAAQASTEASDDEPFKESAAKKLWNAEAKRVKLTVA
jgi:outer membrane murein-binding lipoprotein Lpp